MSKWVVFDLKKSKVIKTICPTKSEALKIAKYPSLVVVECKKGDDITRITPFNTPWVKGD